MRALPGLSSAWPSWPRPPSAQTMTPAAGVPLDVATRRAAIVSNLRYELSLSIPGRARLSFDWHDDHPV